MKSLIIDTASSNLYVALVDDEVKQIHIKGKNHAAVLLKHIDELLGKERLDNVKEIIIGIGPGSYTGVRVAVTVGKILAWTKKLTIKTVSSLYIQVSGYEGIKASMIDARRGNAFCALYDDECLVEEELRSVEDFKMIAKDCKIYTENDFKADAKKIVEKAKAVEVHSLVPNYLRKTEAERNKNGD